MKGQVMMRNSFVFLALATTLLAACVSNPSIPVNKESSKPGGTVTRGGTPFELLGSPIEVGQPLPSVTLYDITLKPVDLSRKTGEVLIVSVVPSIDTGVCEQQTHVLGEKTGLDENIRRVTVSRDLPFAQQRFLEHVDFEGVLFLSDYQNGDFGLQTGLLIDKIRLLARAVLVVDRGGIVRYIQVVPEIGNLPDLERAFAVAEDLARDG